MQKVETAITIDQSPNKAFILFLKRFSSWWPKEYTWSQENLQEIKIEPKINGLCTEIGPHGFRIDWGRVIDYQEGKEITFTWQINPNRVPEPNPEKSSKVKVSFTEKDASSTELKLIHFNFENHGDEGEKYQEMMGSEYGWAFILQKFKTFSEHE